MYHGTPEERAELRPTVMTLSHKRETLPKQKPVRTKKRRLSRRRDFESDKESVIIVEPEEERDSIPEDDDANPTTQRSSFPVVITIYEMIIEDRVHLAKYDWCQVIVDEGHRLKNMDSILMREIKKYPSEGRMLLTGTPLHVSAIPSAHCMRAHGSPRIIWELWSRLNFILPEVFDDVAAFQDSYVFHCHLISLS
jgi:ATP-dependent DNA helicase